MNALISSCCAVALASVPLFHSARAAEANAVSVRAFDPQAGVAERKTTQPATVHPFFEAAIHARATGYLKELRVDIGAPVQGGEVLAVIDAPDLAAALVRTEAEVTLAGSRKLQAEAAVEAARANAAVADSDSRRVETLTQKGMLNQQVLEESRGRSESARAALKLAEAGVTAATAELEASKAARDEQRALASFLEIKAPFNGVVTARNVDPGDLVRTSAGGKPLFVVTQLDPVRARVPVPERDAPAVRVGDKIEFACPGTGKVYPGRVTRRAGRLDDLTRTMLVEVDLPNEKHELLPGMYGTATIFLGSGDQAGLLVPSSALRPVSGGTVVYAIVDGRIKAVPVQVGHDDGLRAQIVKGLEGNERIVADASGRLADGQAVNIVPTD